MKIVINSGYFDPLHVGHIECMELSKKLAGKNGKLVVILNSDHQCVLKKGKPFMNQDERKKIIESLKPVDEVFVSIDKDKSQCESLRFLAEKYRNCDLIFAKGGDRFSHNIPEAGVCKDLGIKLVDGLGEKIQSSSWLVKGSRKNGDKNT